MTNESNPGAIPIKTNELPKAIVPESEVPLNIPVTEKDAPGVAESSSATPPETIHAEKADVVDRMDQVDKVEGAETEKKKKDADWRASRINKISRKKPEWISNVYDYVKLRTVDKWKFKRASGGAADLIDLKESDIQELSGEIGDLREQSVLVAKKNDEDQQIFTERLSAIKDPFLVELYERTKNEKQAQADEKIQRLNTAIDERARKQDLYKADIEKYKEKMAQLESDFNGKVDVAIDSLKKRADYENKAIQSVELGRGIEEAINSLGELENTITEYETVLEDRELIGEDAYHQISEALKDHINSAELLDMKIDAMKREKERRDEYLDGVESKIKSWERFRNKHTPNHSSGETISEDGVDEDVVDQGNNSSSTVDVDPTQTHTPVQTSEGGNVEDEQQPPQELEGESVVPPGALEEEESSNERKGALEDINEKIEVLENVLISGNPKEVVIKKKAAALERSLKSNLGSLDEDEQKIAEKAMVFLAEAKKIKTFPLIKKDIMRAIKTLASLSQE